VRSDGFVSGSPKVCDQVGTGKYTDVVFSHTFLPSLKTAASGPTESRPLDLQGLAQGQSLLPGAALTQGVFELGIGLALPAGWANRSLALVNAINSAISSDPVESGASYQEESQIPPLGRTAASRMRPRPAISRKCRPIAV